MAYTPIRVARLLRRCTHKHWPVSPCRRLAGVANSPVSPPPRVPCVADSRLPFAVVCGLHPHLHRRTPVSSSWSSSSGHNTFISTPRLRFLSPAIISPNQHGRQIRASICFYQTRHWTSSANLSYHGAGFDICQTSTTNVVSEKDEEQVSVMCDSRALKPTVLRPGMVLLKEYLTLDEQASIVRECRRLGLGPGGFYKINARRLLMCLGLDWDPETSRYNKIRRFDTARVPNIPDEFLAMVNRAITTSRDCMGKEYGAMNVEGLLPKMSPQICLLNFYTSEGRLGLHQDRSESRESLVEGIPIVSFSVGDSGEFFYGDGREIHNANKVVLESGDVLIFGGPARHIFHGVQSIIPRSAPDSLIKDTGLRPGRLNLTFRQF